MKVSLPQSSSAITISLGRRLPQSVSQGRRIVSRTRHPRSKSLTRGQSRYPAVKVVAGRRFPKREDEREDDPSVLERERLKVVGETEGGILHNVTVDRSFKDRRPRL